MAKKNDRVDYWALEEDEQNYYDSYTRLKDEYKQGKIPELAKMNMSDAIRFMSEWDRIRFKLNKKLKG